MIRPMHWLLPFATDILPEQAADISFVSRRESDFD